MGKDGTGTRVRGASPEREHTGDEFFEVPATVVDPEAGRRAAAAIAAARGFGVNEVITKESKNVTAALAAHERTLAEEREVGFHPTPAIGLDLSIDTIQEIEGPTRVPAWVEAPGGIPQEQPDQFDIAVTTGHAPSPLPVRSRGRGLTVVVIAVLAAAACFAAFRFGGFRALSPKRAPIAAPASR
jgi:hypothetical protein